MEVVYLRRTRYVDEDIQYGIDKRYKMKSINEVPLHDCLKTLCTLLDLDLEDLCEKSRMEIGHY